MAERNAAPKETNQALLDFLRETVEALYKKGIDAHRYHPEWTDREALAYALSGAEWEWLDKYEEILRGEG